jgi:5-methylcytosine-specific restriction protein A
VTKAGRPVSVWFHRTWRHKAVERALLRRLQPPWNGRYDLLPERRSRAPKPAVAPATAAAFHQALRRQFTRAARAGERSVRVQAGALHRIIGGYPGPRHRMPTCCEVMQSERRPGDAVLQSPPRGVGASLTIEYKVPR